jgi:hypothetical protein
LDLKEGGRVGGREKRWRGYWRYEGKISLDVLKKWSGFFVSVDVNDRLVWWEFVNMGRKKELGGRNKGQ